MGVLHSNSGICPGSGEITSGCSRAQCVNPQMSKHFHNCYWQIWQLLSSNTELQLHLKGVWMETHYLVSNSELSLLTHQYNLLQFKWSRHGRWFFETKSRQTASLASTNIPTHIVQFHQHWGKTVKNAERWRINKKEEIGRTELTGLHILWTITMFLFVPQLFWMTITVSPIIFY